MINSTKLCYETAGRKSDPCIVLIMGIGGQLIHWSDAFFHGLANYGFYVVRFDNRDAGLSAYIDQTDLPELQEFIAALKSGAKIAPPYSLKDMARDVIELLDVLQIKQAHFLGTSMGGIIAQLASIYFPQRVLSLICIASTSSDPGLPPARPEVMKLFFTRQESEQSMASVVENRIRLHQIYHHPDHVDINKIRELYRKTYLRSNRPDGFRRQLFAMICLEPRVEQLKALRLPTLIIHGDYDPVFTVEHGRHLQQCIQGSQMIVVKDMGHGIPDCYCMELVDAINAFLKKTSGGLYE